MKYKILLLFIFLTMTLAESQNNHNQIIKKRIPDFNQYKNVIEKKRAFFRFMRPIIEQENEKILAQRKYIQQRYEQYKKEIPLNQTAIDSLNYFATYYRVKEMDFNSPNHFIQLLTHVDIIPVPLALSQSAIESAWGTSKFAVKANNMFGQWCFTKDCGLVPERRHEDDTHEVRVFASVNESVASYIRNLNRQNAYKKLREIRKKFRDQNKPFDSTELANGLYSYSSQGDTYISKIQKMIRVNQKYFYD